MTTAYKVAGALAHVANKHVLHPTNMMARNLAATAACKAALEAMSKEEEVVWIQVAAMIGNNNA